MTPRARDLLNRSRSLLGASRDSASPPPGAGVELRDQASEPAGDGSGGVSDGTSSGPGDRPASPSARARTRPGVPAAGASQRGPSSPAPARPGTPTAPAGRIPRTARSHREGTGAAAAAVRGGAAQSAAGSGSDALAAICADIALRDLNLVDLLLSQLEEMEAKEEDADRLAELYRLDHLAARLRRNAENLRVLAGHDASGGTADSTALVDVVRAAMSSIDHYSRVVIGRVVSLGVIGFAAEDVGRVLSELLDNATRSSPPTAPVRVGVHLTETGSALLRVEDDGIGFPPERLAQINERLAGEPVLDDDAVRHMGLAVVHRLAIRHGLRTWLDTRQPHGTTASVLIPPGLICELPEGNWSGAQTVQPRPAGAAGRGFPVRGSAARNDPTGGTGESAAAQAAGTGSAAGPGSGPHNGGPHNGAFRLSALSRSAAVDHATHSTTGRSPGSLFGGPGAPPADTIPPADTTPDAAQRSGLLSGPPSTEALTSGTTSTGLPRRVSRSLRTAATDQPSGPPGNAGSPTTAGTPSPDAGETKPPTHTADTADTAASGVAADGAGDETTVPGPVSAEDVDAPASAPTGSAGHDTAAPGPDGPGSNGLNGHRTQPTAPDEDQAADHARLLADLNAFTEGEQTAHRHQRGD
ncbi:ATP-binding protein [Parafrankia sp. FMc2]|uniref:ATP-binding protein n=1 Tax=Parafrankia sp. FMc2 TaxID=3233196 RepID=UPI0034D7565F